MHRVRDLRGNGDPCNGTVWVDAAERSEPRFRAESVWTSIGLTAVLVISFSNLASDPRVDRQIAALRERYDVIAAGLGPPRYEDVAFIDISGPSRTAIGWSLALARLVARRYDSVYWSHPTNVQAFELLRATRPALVVANELASLPIALRLGCPVLFDAHEYSPAEFSEKLLWRLAVSPYIRWQCRKYIPHVAAMTTVAQSIADVYERDTGMPAEVVLNAPPRAQLAPTPVHHPIRIIHHGAARRGRGLEAMIGIADLLDERFTMDFVLVEGSPGYRDELIRRARGRVRFPDPWPMHELPVRANEYDIGLYSLPPMNFNNRSALPNKFFEFIQGRLAIAIGPSPEMARVVRQYKCGIVADDFSSSALAKAINGLHAEVIADFKRASHVAADELCAEANGKLVLRAAEDALGSVGRRG